MTYILEKVLNQGSDDFGEERTTSLEARIGVDLNQVDIEALIQHEVQSKQLEVVLSSLRIENTVSGSDTFCCQLLHFGQYLTLKINLS